MKAEKCPYCGNMCVVVKSYEGVSQWTPLKSMRLWEIYSKYQWCPNCLKKIAEKSKTRKYKRVIESNVTTTCFVCGTQISYLHEVMETAETFIILDGKYNVSVKYKCPQCGSVLATNRYEAKIVFFCPTLVKNVDWKRERVRKLLCDLPLDFLIALENKDLHKAVTQFRRLNTEHRLRALEIAKLVPEIYTYLLAEMLE